MVAKRLGGGLLPFVLASVLLLMSASSALPQSELNRLGELDVDLNRVGIMSFLDYQNLRFLLQVFKREGQGAEVHVLVDGDVTGGQTVQKITQLCKRLGATTSSLPEGLSIADYCLFEDRFLAAVEKALQTALESEGGQIPPDLTEKIRTSWQDHRARPEKGGKKTAGRWFKDVSNQIVNDEASKVGLARYYTESCRDGKDLSPSRERLALAKTLCQDIASRLSVPPIRAVKAIEVRVSN
jgi:hypothetical protein